MQEKLEIINRLYSVAITQATFSQSGIEVNYQSLYNQYQEFLQEKDKKTADKIKEAFNRLSKDANDTSVSFADKLIYGIYDRFLHKKHSECKQYLKEEISNIIEANENESLKIKQLSKEFRNHFINALFDKYCREKQAGKTVSLTEGQYKTFADNQNDISSFVKNKLKDENHKDFEECKIMLNLLFETDKDTSIKILKSCLKNGHQNNEYPMVNQLVQNVLKEHKLDPKTILSDIEKGNLTLWQRFLNLFLKLLGRDQYTKEYNQTKAKQSFVAKIKASKSSVQQSIL